ncbi:PepSY domain-containing protein [Buttiauxella warmboldiae]|uniref:PepSY domain-containing protein n=1 Tax=Buttiauxella warmboldiae TaxID=82993 RepID=A0A3N5DRB6_9ENTR|nr:PepSY-associated TM helix domain-containing protein [Buttiauxella warmboldiae]RPH29731.1 PepSY domain-containing protein [Buttiauxella warmboldiae]
MSANLSQPACRGALLTLLRRLHFYIGLFVGPFIFIASLSGALYVLTPQLESALYHQALRTQEIGPQQPLARQIAAARHYIGEDARIYAVRPAPKPGDTTRVQFVEAGLGESESRAIFVAPATLAIQGDMTVYGTSGVLPLRTWIDQFHRSLLLGNAGRLYSELAASWLWIAALGGIVLWLTSRPKRKLKVRKTPQKKARHWHITLGAALLLGLLFFSVTGLTWSQWAGGNIDKMRSSLGWMTPQVNTTLTPGNEPSLKDPHAEHHTMMPGMAMPAVDDQMWDRVLAAARASGIESNKVEIRPARAMNKAWTVTEIDRAWPTHVDSAAVDPHSFKVIDRTFFADFPLIAKLTRWGIDAHMGVLFGLPNQILLAAFGFGLCAMIILGYRMWWLKRPASSAASPAQTLSEAWHALPGIWRTAVLIIAALFGYCLPVMGASLLLFIAADAVRWRKSTLKLQVS